MQGTRLPDNQAPKNPGEYSWMSYENWDSKPSIFTGKGEWHLVAPNGNICALREENGRSNHTWEIHEDGSLTVNPSIVFAGGWHGFLIRGVFS